jgi:hypothetical protein
MRTRYSRPAAGRGAAGAYCLLAHDAVRLLPAHGRNTTRMDDGMLEWRLADLPVTA